MALRRIRNNINTINCQNVKNSVKVQNDQQIVFYDEDQPTHPKTCTQSKLKWENSKLRKDIGKAIRNNDELKVSTARERSMQIVKKQEAGRFTALNSSRNSRIQVVTPSENKSQQKWESLFIPQRNKLALNKKKFPFASPKQNMRKSSFSNVKPKVQNNPSDAFRSNNQQHCQLQTYGKSKLKPLDSTETICQASNLRRFQKQQKEREKLLNNRLKFITIDSQRQKNKLQVVKRKYEKVLSVRSESLKEKETFNQRKLSNYLVDMTQKHSRIHLVKAQQSQRRMSISRVSQNKTIEASMLREKLRQDERDVSKSKLQQLQKKKKLVKHTQLSLENSRERISQINRSRISSIRSIQNRKITRNYMNVQKREIVTQKLYQTLQRQIKLINEKKLKSASQLKQYQDLLGLKGNRSRRISVIPKQDLMISQQGFLNDQINDKTKIQRTVSNTFSTSGSKSFYLTNY